MRIITTRNGLRLSQHGVVISELRTTPGPTHSVFDVLAALVAELAPAGRVGVLGFAGGGMMAPLRGLGWERRIESVDLERTGHELFQRHCPAWAGGVRWAQGDAVDWLRRQRGRFALLLEDLSIPRDGDVIKPAVSWEVLPGLMLRRLRPGGVGLANLLRPTSGRWSPDLPRLAAGYATARVVEFDEFENRILVGGDELPSARELGRSLRAALRQVRSRQAGRIRVRHIGS